MDGEAGQPKGEHLNLIVKDATGGEVQFKVKSTTKFGKIFTAYANKKSLDVRAIKFLFDGNRLQDDMTPAEMEMEDGDAIDAMLEQVGGAV
ncbi:MAG: small ubiquitin-like modifier 2 [Monoraphidium minutum]|nr:MAG: small ubiquitin-like modifier 2 [Monoraphidium minutum]